jgi:hypothetical protein
VTSISNINIAGGRYTETPERIAYEFYLANAFTSTRGTLQPGSLSGAYTFAQVGAIADALLARINAGAPAVRTFSYEGIRNNYNSDTGGFYNEVDPPFTTITTEGYAAATQGPWDNRSNDITFGTGQGWYIGGNRYFPPATENGTPSSAFGFTVQGGTEGNPSPNGFFGSISVIPGQTYQIIVGTPSSNDSSTPAQVNFQFVQG